MSYEKFLAVNGNKLVGHYLLLECCGKRFKLDAPRPPSGLSEEGLGQLKSRINECMPLDSMILDLWDWDVHFEDALGNDWYFESAFGDASSVDSCADRVADFFLEKCGRFATDYEQHTDPVAFDALIREEARDFIVAWRDNTLSRYVQRGAAGMSP